MIHSWAQEKSSGMAYQEQNSLPAYAVKLLVGLNGQPMFFALFPSSNFLMCLFLALLLRRKTGLRMKRNPGTKLEVPKSAAQCPINNRCGGLPRAGM